MFLIWVCFNLIILATKKKQPGHKPATQLCEKLEDVLTAGDVVAAPKSAKDLKGKTQKNMFFLVVEPIRGERGGGAGQTHESLRNITF